MEKYIICAYSKHGRLDIVHEFWAEDREDSIVKSVDYALSTEDQYDTLFVYSFAGIINFKGDCGVTIQS